MYDNIQFLLSSSNGSTPLTTSGTDYYFTITHSTSYILSRFFSLTRHFNNSRYTFPHLKVWIIYQRFCLYLVSYSNECYVLRLTFLYYLCSSRLILPYLVFHYPHSSKVIDRYHHRQRSLHPIPFHQCAPSFIHSLVSSNLLISPQFLLFYP